ncbi:MAG TPA: HepT-like ribonuclease domain-containing protein [Burkholderiales bacterium]|nr:HepT-like ribonuclease domain-containing protein [Burkholderiales bacterium]
MARAAAAILQDIVDAGDAIRRYTACGHDAFVADEILRDAVIARLIQMGQAVKDIQAAGVKLQELRPEVGWKQIAGLRDRLAHRYWGLEVEPIWTFVETELPKVIAAVRALGRTVSEPKRALRRKSLKSVSDPD